MEKIFKLFMKKSYLLLLPLLVLCSCNDVYEVSLGIGDGNVDDDAVRVNYKLPSKINDNYVLEGVFTAESKADFTDNYIFSFSYNDPFFAQSYSESVLFSISGEKLRESDFNFKVNFGTLSSLFKKTDEESKCYFVLHAEKAQKGDVTKWNSSEYVYTFDGETVNFNK